MTSNEKTRNLRVNLSLTPNTQTIQAHATRTHFTIPIHMDDNARSHTLARKTHSTRERALVYKIRGVGGV